MADQKISQLTDGTSFQAGDEAVVNRSGTNYKVDPTQFAELDVKGGDVSFYEDTGTTPKFFWDASAEALGIGTTSPTGKLHLQSSSAFVTQKFASSVGDAANITAYRASPASLALYLACNRDSSTGVFADTSAAASNIALFGESNNGYIRFSTSSTNNTAPAERMRISSSGNVGIGTSSPDKPLHITTSSNSIIRLEDDDSSAETNSLIGALEFYSIEAENSGPGVKAAVRGYNESTDGNGFLAFYTGNTSSNDNEAMRIDSSGNLLVGTQTSPSDTGTVVADGIYLGGTAAANLLDDYEEGTWTPTYEGSTTNPTVTHDLQEGYYTKIGNIVQVSCIIGSTSFSGGSGDLLIAGLPFAQDTAGAFQIGHGVVEQNSFSSNPPALVEFNADSGTLGPSKVGLKTNFSSASGTRVLCSDAAAGAGSNRVRFMFTYRAA